MMSIWRNSVGLPIKGLVERNHDYNQNADMVVKFRDLENKDCRNNEDAAQKQQWHQPQPQVPKRPAIHWENFLPVRSLKVLLVENDDSTRYTVSALLRNCSYEVTAVSNGLEAWETLEDVTNHVDLVLTEVAMPRLSGIDLLSKIMSDKTCKNIPVIMMSSNDSMSIVFKCLSNGAVDFLVKPIRKNELKNLWQHVWRKCHGSGGGGGSGSGSESGMQTQNSTKSKSVDGSNNDTDLNYEEGNGSTGLIVRNGSDNDSSTQSACSIWALEVHSSQPISQCDDMANLPDSTCAHVIHSRLEAQGSNWVSANATTIIQNEGNERDDVTMGIDLTLGSPTTSELQFRNPSDEVLAKVSSTGVSKFLDSDIKKDEKKQGKEVVEDSTVTENSDIKRKDNDATVSITNVTLSCGEIVRNELVSDPSKVKHVDLYDGKEPSLELSLQRLRDLGSSSRTNDQTLNILRHSDHSAFSRYNATSTNRQACSSVNRSLEVGKIESMQQIHREISRTQNQGSNGSCNNFDMGSTSNCVSDLHREIRVTPNQGSKGSSNNCDMGSTSNRISDKPESVDDKPISVHNCHAFQPVRHGHCPSGQTGISDTAKTVTTHGMAMHQTPQIEHHHYHHHHHHVRGLQQQQMSLDSDDLSSANIIDAAPNCGMSDKLGMGIEGNAANYESASGSNNGSNGLNGRNSIVGGTNVSVDNNTPGACVAVSGNRSAVEHDRLALREAALIKFRQKRKERCFEKKVRYQSRKKLAEQRPRVRGQFVKQTLDDNQKGNECV